MADKKESRPLLQDNRPEYEPPRATRLSDFQTGSGGAICTPTGSGDLIGCTTGNSAGDCITNGNSAAVGCTTAGNSVLPQT